MQKTWIITGSARGLGRAILTAVLESGDNVLATARNVAQLADLKALYGDRIEPFALDVTDEARAGDAATAAIAAFGRIDVLVNNAGYGHFEAFEQKSSADFRAEVETNLFGVVNMTRAVLPFMRERGSGHILNVSSVGGRVGTPGLSAYQAAKWAVGGFTEVLRSEVAHLGIRIVSLEPGGMRTDWADIAGNAASSAVLPDYADTVGVTLERIRAYAGNEVGDPARIAQVILGLSRRDDVPAHLVLGTDALASFDAAEAERGEAHARWIDVSRATVFDGPEGEALTALLPPG
ncbi:short-subunit dehydrogenase [Novosphingobium sp. PhB165]|uniref:SDR family NAD(P)-dependent oxidoreductase n=1 Tax=Novosphingobium sp. PhB165 TaxID=2485105 RepID=UPI001047874A|nr:SDR family NAD(P)-dependent oxidoreductase [Novosphingobium sp. PhB165]TCM15759.1 short-subunit dehydrogenase [Novosphingobium sp. PhB165]